mmetsp:Transcript_2793/g.6508  ORF Transcript_2793/g.6508 Transcript_2793/m.6508 type:complete len:201 (-) Transcript_2793:389-991(-)
MSSRTRPPRYGFTNLSSTRRHIRCHFERCPRWSREKIDSEPMLAWVREKEPPMESSLLKTAPLATSRSRFTNSGTLRRRSIGAVNWPRKTLVKRMMMTTHGMMKCRFGPFTVSASANAMAPLRPENQIMVMLLYEILLSCWWLLVLHRFSIIERGKMFTAREMRQRRRLQPMKGQFRSNFVSSGADAETSSFVAFGWQSE